MNDSSPAPELSVAVCSWNPAPDVEDALASLRHQTLAAERYEVLVIDNASGPERAAVLVEACARLGFRYLREPRLGLSHARNRAVREASGRYLYFIDDDAVAPAHLCATLLARFEASGADVVGGPAHGLWAATPPPWLGSRHWRLLSLICYGEVARELRYPEILLGCNVAFRTALLAGDEAFRVDLGRSGPDLLGGEERALQRWLMAAGRRVVYDPRAYVFHRVTRARMTRAYLVERTRGGAASEQRMDGGRASPAHLLAAFAYRQVLNLLRALRYAVDMYLLDTRLQIAAMKGAAVEQRSGHGGTTDRSGVHGT